MVCSQCNRQIPDRSNFCPACGARIAAAAPLARPAPGTANKPEAATKKVKAKGKGWWVFAVVCALAGITMFDKHPFPAVLYLLSGLFFSPPGYRVFLRLTGLKIHVALKVLGAVVVVVLASLMFSALEAGKEQQELRAQQRRTEVSDSLAVLAEGCIARGALDSARMLLNRAGGQNPRASDKAADLRRQMAALGAERKKHSVLVTLSDQEFRALRSNRLSKKYLKNEPLNALFIEDMYENRGKRATYIAQEKKRRAEEARQARLAREKKRREDQKRQRELAAAQVTIRKEYQKLLRNQYLDGGLDIKVYVTGKENRRLILTYALFNDVWFRKLQTSGNFDAWHKLGFTRVDVKDGYDYHKYMKW